MKRRQTALILRDLTQKMVLLAGPRQVGKTFIAKQILKEYIKPVYLNYDSVQDKSIIENQAWLLSTDLIVFDEIHKMSDWKNYLKGIYDTKPDHTHILVTGSARLEVYNQLGDSLAGRYFLHRLLPLSVAELTQLKQPFEFDFLLEQGGFPEPFLASNKVEANRWRFGNISIALLATDVFEFDKVQNIKALRLIFELLRTKVGSPVSYLSITAEGCECLAYHRKKIYSNFRSIVYCIFSYTVF